MHAFDKRTIETVETADEIQFIVRRSWGWAIPALLVLALFGAVLWAIRSHNRESICSVIVAALALLTIFLRGNTTTLTVSHSVITAQGNLGEQGNSYLSLETLSLESLEYNSGDEDRSRGLYATEGFSRRCLIPDLDEDECQQIINAIYRKFPGIEIGDRDGSSLLFDENGGLIRLGLDKP